MATYPYAVGDVVPAPCRGGAVTIGNFDGVHKGHQALIAEAVEQARLVGGPAVAVTFDPHPTQMLRPASFQPLLTTAAERAELLQACGADHVLILQTSPVLLALRAAEFFQKIIIDGLQAVTIVEGFNFGFGKDREGTLDLLQQLARQAGIAVQLLSAVELHGKPVSTSRVRNEILAGNMTAARELMGRPYRLSGTVGVGQRRGAGLGFPTANLQQIPTLVPGDGVYAVRAFWQEKSWPGAANVGPNPTFGEQARKVEVHLIGFSGDLYGQSLTIDFLDKIRDTRPFASADELIRQIQDDVQRAQQLFSPGS